MSYGHQQGGYPFGPGPQFGPQHPRRPNRWPVIIAVLAGTGMSAAVIGAFLYARLSALPEREAETVEEKYEEAAAAFSGKLSSHDEELVGIEKLFQKFGRAHASRNEALMEECLNGDRMYREFERLADFQNISSGEKRGIRGAMNSRLASKLIENRFLDFDDFTINHCRFLAAKNEAVVYVRYNSDDAVSSKMRWWVVKDNNGWRIYDYEDLDVSMRVSDLMAMTMAHLSGNPQKALQATAVARSVLTVMQNLANEEFEAAEQGLENISLVELATLPNALQALYWMQWTTLHCGFERYSEALEAADKAQSLHDDMPILLFLRAAAHNGLGEFAEAEKYANQYLSMLGEDAKALEELGYALLGQERREEAVAAFRRGIVDEPNYVDMLIGLGTALPAGEKAEVGTQFANLRDPAEWFEMLCESFIAEGDYDSVEVIIAAYRRVGGQNDPDLAYYDAWVKLQNEKYDEAAAIVWPAIAKVDDPEERGYFLDLYFDGMLGAGKAIEAYEKADDTVYAFDYLADALYYDDNYDQLDKLIAAHEKASVRSPWLNYHKGEVAESREQWDYAIAAYRAGLRLDNAGTNESYRINLVHAMFQVHKDAEAYESVEPRREVFAQLGNLISVHAADENADRTKMADRLAALVGLHRKNDPNDPAVFHFDAAAHWIRRDYAQVITVLREHRGAIQASEAYKFDYDDRLVRGLLHEKRFDEALQAAEAADNEYDYAVFLQALVHASRGDVPQTMAAIEKYLNDDPDFYGLEFVYGDEMFGPILRSEPFAEVRRRFSEPEPVE